MGRLLRKKPVTKKRKKENDDSRPSSQSQADNDKLKSGSAVSVLPSQKKTPAAAVRQASFIDKGYAGRAVQFLREVRAELRKVTWPSRKQTVGSTVVVIILVMIISFFLGAVDIGLSSLVRSVLQ